MSSIVALPTKGIDPAKFKAAIERGLETQAKKVKTDFEKTTDTWDDKVDFTITGSNGQRIVGTAHKIYNWVNNGTPAHLISPVNKRFLRFPGSFGPKTAPGLLYSLTGQKGGPEVFTPHPVLHPGTKPRSFDKLIAKQAESELAKAINSAIAAGVK
jgi:hypothetical protein